MEIITNLNLTDEQRAQMEDVARSLEPIIGSPAETIYVNPHLFIAFEGGGTAQTVGRPDGFDDVDDDD